MKTFKWTLFGVCIVLAMFNGANTVWWVTGRRSDVTLVEGVVGTAAGVICLVAAVVILRRINAGK